MTRCVARVMRTSHQYRPRKIAKINTSSISGFQRDDEYVLGSLWWLSVGKKNHEIAFATSYIHPSMH